MSPHQQEMIEHRIHTVSRKKSILTNVHLKAKPTQMHVTTAGATEGQRRNETLSFQI